MTLIAAAEAVEAHPVGVPVALRVFYFIDRLADILKRLNNFQKIGEDCR